MLERFNFRLERRRKQAAYQEVVEAFQSDPIAAYGLYLLVNDSGLLSRRAQRRLRPFVENVEHRMQLTDDALKIKIPMDFDPITDVEHDTLTYVIAEALREFTRDIDSVKDKLLLAQMRGINSILERHASHTASISFEIDICAVVGKLLDRCAKGKKYQQPDGTSNIEDGDYFVVSRLRQFDTSFTKSYRDERNLKVGDIVECTTDWGRGYVTAFRLSGESNYTRIWSIHQVRKALTPDSALVIIHEKEGHFVSPLPHYRSAVNNFVELICTHDLDRSPDPTTYSPDYESAV